MNAHGPTRTLLAAAALGALLAVGCEEKPKGEAAADAGAADAAKGPVLDSRLESAVEAAATATAGAPNAPPKQANGDAPPESGVFGPGLADKTQPRGAPSKIELLSEGSEPRAKFATALDAAEHKATLTIAVRMGPQQAMPSIDYGITWKAEGAQDKAKDAHADGAPAGVTRVIAKVASASLSQVQPGAIPKEVGAEIAKLKGSTLELMVSKNGALGDVKTEASKGARPELATMIDALADGLTTLWVPVPDKPVGAGGYWMTTDRGRSMGLDVLRYRVFRVEKVEGDTASVSVETRQYAADENTIAALVGAANAALELFESQGKGDLALAAKNPFLPTHANVSQRVQARIKAGGNQRKMLQVELTAAIGGQAPAAAQTPAMR